MSKGAGREKSPLVSMLIDTTRGLGRGRAARGVSERRPALSCPRSGERRVAAQSSLRARVCRASRR